jgi:peptidoglycan/LPS O-acetylase OafA/YrhL
MTVGVVARVVVYRTLGPAGMLSSICNFDSIIAGCLLALLLDARETRVRTWWQKVRLVALPAAGAAVLGVMWLAKTQRLGVITVPLGNTIMAVGLVLFVLEVLTRDRGILRAVLNSSILVGIGTLSYSIYLWQQLILRPAGLAVLFRAGPWLDSLPVSLILILLLAAASYFGVERSLLNRRKQLH